jgi:uncharacterized membrane protein
MNSDQVSTEAPSTPRKLALAQRETPSQSSARTRMLQAADLPMLVLTSFSCGLLWVRMARTGEARFRFLLWNLFLALLPLLVGRIALLRPRRSGVVVALLVVWLALFPNAPYLVTDLVHLTRAGSSAPLWFDLLLLLSFGVTGLLFAFRSLDDVLAWLCARLGHAVRLPALGGLCLLASFGIYLGRFLRWNSWDLLTSPRRVASSVVEILSGPKAFSALGFSGLFAGFLVLAYWGWSRQLEISRSRTC